MIRLTLLHTNDLHGHVEQLARIGTLVRNIRTSVEVAGGTCYYFDCGDCEDTRQLESSLTKGASMDALLRAAGCDAVVLGNAIPLRYGYQAIAGLAAELGKPILCANLRDENGSQIEGLESFRILEQGELKIGLIGLTDDMGVYESVFHMQVFHPKQILPELIEKVKAAGAKTVILLSHLASKVDIELAGTISGVDLILGGHDHQVLYPPREVKGCIIAQAGQYGEHLGRLELELDETSGKILHYHAELVDIVDEIPLDEAVQAAVLRNQQYAQRLMNKIIGRVEVPLDLAVDRECAAGDLLADALLARYPQAQCALALAGHWRYELACGEISQGGLFAACRSSANPCLCELSGAQIMAFLRKALAPANSSRVIDRQLRGGFVGLPHVAGLHLQWNGRSPESLQVRLAGQPLQQDAIYTVASTDMEFSEFIGYLTLPDDRVRYEVPIVVPEVLQEHITRFSPIRQIPGDRISLL